MEPVWFSSHTVTQLTMLLLAFVLSAMIGFERRRKLKSAGLRTHTLVGLGSAVFTLVSAFGFQGVLDAETIVDPSRIAAQIVSGVGFLGAGVIFVRRSSVSGLTTAASIWSTSAIGMACGAGQPTLAMIAASLHLLAVTLLGRLSGSRALSQTQLIVRLRPKRGALPRLAMIASEHGYAATILSGECVERRDKPDFFIAKLVVQGPASGLERFLHELSAVPGVKSVQIPGSQDA